VQIDPTGGLAARRQ